MSSLFLMLAAPAIKRARLLATVLLLLVAGSLAARVAAADLALTLAEAQRLALTRSQQLPAQDQAVIAARELAVAAGQRPDPTLKIGIDNLPVSGDDKFSLTRDFMTMRRIGLMQEVTRSDKLTARAQRFRGVADKSLAEKESAIAAIQRDTALAWLERYYAEQLGAAIGGQVAAARREVQAADSAYRGGRGNQADLFNARSALVAIEDRQSEAERRIRNARILLARWSGAPADTPLSGMPAIDTVRLDPATLDTTLDHHPQFAALRSQEAIARAEADLALANRKTDWSVEVAFQQRGSAYSNMVSVGLSLPLQWDQKNRQNRELQAKLAAVEQVKDERAELLRTHIAETRTMVNDWENGRERIARYQNQLLPLARERTAALLGAYRGGKAGLADVLAARRNELEVQQQALTLQADTAKLWAQLNFLFPDTQALPAALQSSPEHINLNSDSK